MPRIAWINEFFQEFNPGERDHLRFKHVNDMPEKEKYHIFDLLLWVLKVDIYSYQMFWVNIDLASCGYEDLINMADFNPFATAVSS